MEAPHHPFRLPTDNALQALPVRLELKPESICCLIGLTLGGRTQASRCCTRQHPLYPLSRSLDEHKTLRADTALHPKDGGALHNG